MNNVIVTGRFTRKPELRTFGESGKVTNFSVAINEQYRDRNGDKQEDTTFVNGEVFGKQAEIVSQFGDTGRLVLVQGKLKNNSWEKDGQKHNTLVVLAEKVEFLDRPKQQEEKVPAQAPVKSGTTPRKARF